VIASEGASALVTTDKVSYLATDPVTVTGRIRNTSANVDLAAVSAAVQVLDSQGTEVFNSIQSVGTLFLGADAQVPACGLHSPIMSTIGVTRPGGRRSLHEVIHAS